MELERVLTKLRYDDSVSGYALFTNDGIPFLSFSLPEETVPTIKATMRIHSDSLKMMNVMTGAGIVVLARIDLNWILGVLFHVTESLGSALQKTQDVISLMANVELPPPPARIVEPSVVVSVETPVAPEIKKAQSKDAVVDYTPIPLDEIDVRHGCTVFKGPLYKDAMRLDSPLNDQLRKHCTNVGVDLCLMIDEKRTVFKMAEILGRSVEEAIDIVRKCVSLHIMNVKCPDVQELGAKEIVEVPHFEGDLKKVKKEHRAVLELCDGNRSLQLIADMLRIPYFTALQSTVPYKGKSVTFIKKAKAIS